jgi:hypothetical protein
LLSLQAVRAKFTIKVEQTFIDFAPGRARALAPSPRPRAVASCHTCAHDREVAALCEHDRARRASARRSSARKDS